MASQFGCCNFAAQMEFDGSSSFVMGSSNIVEEAVAFMLGFTVEVVTTDAALCRPGLR